MMLNVLITLFFLGTLLRYRVNCLNVYYFTCADHAALIRVTALVGDLGPVAVGTADDDSFCPFLSKSIMLPSGIKT